MNSYFDKALEWLNKHQTYSSSNTDIKISYVSHPLGDGDGFATRVYRLVNRIVPLLLRGDVVVLEGGFRGYTDNKLGFISLFKPFSNEVGVELPEWEKFPPKDLLQKSYEWWLGVVMYYFLRPNQTLDTYIQNIKNELSYEHIGLHLRYGDNNYGRSIDIKKYKDLVNEMDEYKCMYIATDSSMALNYFLSDQTSGLKKVFQKNTFSLDMSRPGTSAAEILIRNEKQEWITRVATEVICDILLLSECSVLIGLKVSQVTNVAKLIGLARGNIAKYYEF